MQYIAQQKVVIVTALTQTFCLAERTLQTTGQCILHCKQSLFNLGQSEVILILYIKRTGQKAERESETRTGSTRDEEDGELVLCGKSAMES